MMTPILATALVLHLSNFSGAPASAVHRVQDEVTRVYAAIGVSLDWSETREAETDPQPSIRVILLPYETGGLRHSEKAVMGSAVHTADGSAIAYVYYRRVQAEAARYDVSTDLVLACAIAHELGHLLLPIRAHAPDGLMRACWSREDFHRAGHGELTFLPMEAERIRGGLSGRTSE
jgi:hypothetical protein